MQINFHAEDWDFDLQNSPKIEDWLKIVIQKEGSTLEELTYIFCSDAYLHQMNVKYLEHDTYTDVITFQYATDKVHGDIFISVERTNENAKTFGVSPEEELRRVIVHGLLHLLGYQDKTDEAQAIMTQKENEYLAVWEGLLV